MGTDVPPKVDCDQIHAGLSVTDISEAVEFYTKRLGFTLGFLWGDPPRFAGMNLGKRANVSSTGNAGAERLLCDFSGRGRR